MQTKSGVSQQVAKHVGPARQQMSKLLQAHPSVVVLRVMSSQLVGCPSQLQRHAPARHKKAAQNEVAP